MTIHNFNAGPAALPASVLERLRADLLDTHGTGISIMEWSHRSTEFEAVRDRAETLVRELIGAGPEWAVLFLQGGASLQFHMAPLNLLPAGASADFLVSGSWGAKALAEARLVAAARGASVREASGAASRAKPHNRVPEPGEIELDPAAAWVHLTTNETIEGVQWPALPEVESGKIVADASSDILAAPLDLERFALVYAGAQKNLGPSGVTLVLARRELLGRQKELPAMLDYAVHDANSSLYNTPNTWGIHALGLVCEWIRDQGGAAGMSERNRTKSRALYEFLDSSAFYRPFAATGSRSTMNVTFTLPSKELETLLVREASAAGFLGLAGHRSVGGLRASLYNAVELESVRALIDFLGDFEARHSNAVV